MPDYAIYNGFWLNEWGIMGSLLEKQGKAADDHALVTVSSTKPSGQSELLS